MVRTLGVIDGDLTLDKNGNMQVVTDLEGLRQKIIQKLTLFKGEWFLDVEAGLPYFQDVLIKGVDVGLVSTLINTEILDEPEVLEVTEFTADLDPDTRKFTYAATVSTVFGETEIVL